MNEFEKRFNALRLQYKAEQRQITKDAYLTIGHINNAIGMVNSKEARDVLRAEKERLYEAMRRTHEVNRLGYTQQLEALADEYAIHLDRNPSNSKMRRLMSQLCQAAEARGQRSCSIRWADNRTAVFAID